MTTTTGTVMTDLLFNNPDAVAITVFGLIFYGLAIHRWTAKHERANIPEHTCPEPIIKTVTVERPHDPWQPQPWMRVDTLEQEAA